LLFKEVLLGVIENKENNILTQDLMRQPSAEQHSASTSESTGVGISARVIRLTETAARRIADLAAAEKNPALMLRLAVEGGGCAGFQYRFSLDAEAKADDHVFQAGVAKLVIDDTSLDLVAGAELDFVESLLGASFELRNPQARSSCGCGASFSL
jgi:iron-sulfur cluster insertion protein